MSADNGVYILYTKDNQVEISPGCFENHHNDPVNSYRVAHTSGIDNFDYYEENQIYMLGLYMHEIWGKSKVHHELKDAVAEAIEILKKLSVCEYGIVEISDGRYSFT